MSYSEDTWEQKIIEREIQRLDKKYLAAQERYGYTGSAYSDKTMHRYQVIRDALDDHLNHNKNEALVHSNLAMIDQLKRIKNAVEVMQERKLIPDNAAEYLLLQLKG